MPIKSVIWTRKWELNFVSLLISSWYSWTLNSLVNGVYAFGFLFMLPQLFVNYKLKSVAALPWRSFMYKAFNTFIDDIFAFIIAMATAHRIACFRDDIVFVIYLVRKQIHMSSMAIVYFKPLVNNIILIFFILHRNSSIKDGCTRWTNHAWMMALMTSHI